MPASWPPRSAILCLVTDRLGLARELGSAVDPIDALRLQVAAAVDAGIDLVHVRERDLEAGALRDLVAECVQQAAGSATRVLVNDRVDVALVAGAHGVHLRGDSYAASEARTLIPPGFLLGRSVRRAAAVPATAPADYLVLGTVFATPSKPGGETVVGIEELRQAAARAPVPLLAIGGISEERLAEVAQAGASGVAAIRLFFGLHGGDPRVWRQRVARWREVFDTNRPIS